jgi:hypothetical protein
MLINGSQLPSSVLEALGMPSSGGFQIRLVKAGGPGGRMMIDDVIEDTEEGGDAGGAEDSVPTAAEVVEIAVAGNEDQEEEEEEADEENGEKDAAPSSGEGEAVAGGGGRLFLRCHFRSFLSLHSFAAVPSAVRHQNDPCATCLPFYLLSSPRHPPLHS